jgi:hypothetical protein
MHVKATNNAATTQRMGVPSPPGRTLSLASLSSLAPRTARVRETVSDAKVRLGPASAAGGTVLRGAMVGACANEWGRQHGPNASVFRHSYRMDCAKIIHAKTVPDPINRACRFTLWWLCASARSPCTIIHGCKWQSQRVVHDELRQPRPKLGYLLHRPRWPHSRHEQRSAPPDAVMIPRRRTNDCTGCRPLLVPVERSPLGHDSATGRLTAINIVSRGGWEDISLWQPNRNGTA